MDILRASVSSIWLAFFVAACSSTTNTTSDPDPLNPQLGGAGGSGNANSNVGGSTTGPAGGSTTSPAGGSTTSPAGGSTTSPAGGSTTGPAGGSTTGPAGGSTTAGGSSSKGGSTTAGGSSSKGGSTTAGGSSGKGGGYTEPGGATGGSGGSSKGGSSTGGATGVGGAGGNATGGVVSSTGGAAAGGAAAGGAAAGGGTSEPQLVTSNQSAYWKTDGAIAVVTTGTADVTVNDTSTAQTWEGFGGAFNEMGWNYLAKLSQADRDLALQLLFGVDGAHFNYGRIPMGASDYAMSRYTLDETANDTAMASFSIARDKEKLIPFIKAAQAVRSDIHFWASPWTPPTWMKNSPFKAGTAVSPFDGGTMKNDATTLKALAQYFVKFVQAYAAEGITIEAVAPQNEPNFDQNYPSCLWGSSTFVSFIGAHLGPAFTAANITSKIMLGTMSNNNSDPAIISAVMADSTAKSYVKMIGMQWGTYDSLSSAKSHNLPIWQTEHKCGNYPWNPSGSPAYVSTAPNDQAYGVESWGYLRDWIKGGVTSYSAWNMVLDKAGKGIDTTRDWAQNALLVVDGTTLKKTPAYHVFRHFSQFVDPGAKVVGTSGSNDAVAFKNSDGTIVLVMYNSGGAKTTIVSVGGKKLSFSMPGQGWATVNWK